jgi:hypothetical protein
MSRIAHRVHQSWYCMSSTLFTLRTQIISDECMSIAFICMFDTCIGNVHQFYDILGESSLCTLFLVFFSSTCTCRGSVAEWLRHRSHTRRSLTKAVSVRILLVKIWMCEKVCQFTCGRSVHFIMYLGSLFQ